MNHALMKNTSCDFDINSDRQQNLAFEGKVMSHQVQKTSKILQFHFADAFVQSKN